MSSLPRSLNLFAKASICLTAFSWGFALLGHLLGMRKPYSWPYYWVPNDQFADFTAYSKIMPLIHTRAFFHAPVEFLYPAPLGIFYEILFDIWGKHDNSIIILWAFIIFVVAVATYKFWQAFQRRNITQSSTLYFFIVMILCSYPFYFLMQRGNVEICVWVFLLSGIAAYRHKRFVLASLLLGVAIACKWYPVIMLGMFFRTREYKYIVLAMVSAICATVFSAWLLGPTTYVALAECSRGTSLFIAEYGKRYWQIGYDHSAFSFFKMITFHYHPNLNVSLNIYLVLISVMCCVLYFLRIRKMPAINQILTLLIIAVTIPPVSYDYTLIELYIGFGIYSIYVLDQALKHKTPTAANWVMLLFAMAFTPQSYVIWHSVRYGAQVRFLALVCLLYLFLKFPLEEGTISENLPESPAGRAVRKIELT